MKSPTPHYRDLVSALKKAKLITGGIDRLGCQTDLQHLKLQSYILLCHSALEQYLEELGLSAAKKARSIFTSSGTITKTLVALISSKIVDDLPDKSKAKLTSELSSNIEVFSKEAFNRYRSVVNSNNGIVDRDQKKILIPIGVDPETIDIVLMNNLHTFGAKRGDVAHKFKVQRTETLTSIDTDLAAILKAIIVYDQAVCSALKSRMR
ncbi:MAG: HEPN domain-containing protein [Pseudomonadota bacterium]|uniref:HEPN domain-containing protein n=1 Tax=Gallaecimonas pentaromativorans TaxID=584787 RepID=UPI0012EDAAAD|nr:HEPN domain-containing protein [Gallaecimonas pentaromativorans]MED5524627.1 HEPN domain-containing protein [Pseudomonadota bacterium]